MKLNIIHCPACGEKTKVSELSCSSCGTKVQGDFDLCPFCQLPPDAYEFLLTFLRCRGSIRDVERTLGISYPTVRSRLDELLRFLNLEASELSESDIIDRLERSEITPDQAVEFLKNRRR
jgi:hypothetical protein